MFIIKIPYQQPWNKKNPTRVGYLANARYGEMRCPTRRNAERFDTRAEAEQQGRYIVSLPGSGLRAFEVIEVAK